MSNFTESDLIFNAMTPAEQARAWEIFTQVSSGQLSQAQAQQAQQQNEQRAREQLNQFFSGGSTTSTAPPATTGTTQQCGPGEVWDPETNACQLISFVEQRQAERDKIARDEEAKQKEKEKELEDSTTGTNSRPNVIFQGLGAYLNSIGLGSLFSFEGGKPSGWLWEQIKSGVQTKDELLFALEQTPEFQKRFAVIFTLRNTPGAYVPSAGEVLDYEKGFNELMIGSGVPSWFYDSYDDAQNAMARGLSLTQVEGRLERGFQTMRRMPTEVRDVFAEYYGEQADNALLAAILDPQKTLDEIDRSVRTAQISGFGREIGLSIGRAQAERLGGVQMTESQIRQGIQASAALRPLTQETFGEATDITEAQAVEAGLGQSAMDQQLLENRLRTRQAQQANIGGGATISAQGVLGAGVI